MYSKKAIIRVWNPGVIAKGLSLAISQRRLGTSIIQEKLNRSELTTVIACLIITYQPI